MAQMTRLGIIGADGRMGEAVKRLAGDNFDLVAEITKNAPDFDALGACDAVIDFSTPDALLSALPHLREGVALVSGTTGLTDAQETEVKLAAKTAAILRSGNFSVGINILCQLAEQAARTLGEGWDIEITEMHHRHKVDAPSGTALMLGEAAAEGRSVDLSSVSVFDRNGARKDGDIGFSVLRGGGVYGDHEVRLVSESQMITLGHRALNRDVFAEGALGALGWLQDQASGYHTMADWLRL